MLSPWKGNLLHLKNAFVKTAPEKTKPNHNRQHWKGDTGMKTSRFFMLMLALTTFILCSDFSSVAFGSASGIIEMNIETEADGKIASVEGSAT
jgi:hypothetical protein